MPIRTRLMRIPALNHLVLTGMASLALCLPLASAAQEAAPAPLTEQSIERLDLILDEISLQQAELDVLRARLDTAEGVPYTIMSARFDRVWTSTYQDVLSLAGILTNYRADGFDISAYFDRVAEDLSALPAQAYESMDRLRAQAVFPTGDLEPEEFVFADRKLFHDTEELDAIFSVLITYTEVAAEFGLDSAEVLERLVEALADTAASRSIFLDLALRRVESLRESVATLPDSANLADGLRAAQARVQLTAAAMQETIGLMTRLGLETRQLRQQVLTVTREITTDVLDVGIVASLVSGWTRAGLDVAAKEGPRVIFRLLLVAFIFFVFFQLAKLVQKGVEHGLESSRVHISNLLKRMIISSVRNIIVIVGFLIAISQLGISLGPLLAGLGIAGFIIGFALQDSLGNFASGLMILLYRPFDVGDVVEAGGVRGRVSHMSLVNTTFMTLDNQRLVVPNNLIWQSVITNVTAQRTRRIDLIIGVGYSDDIEKTQRVLEEILETSESVLAHPAPVVRVHELGESSVNFVVRPWVKTGDYWEVHWELTKQIKLRFDKEGISIPFPQRDVHLIPQD